eukprot:TRINITY_DN6532_c0_g1_i3.p1 TRINITY_DN6532_c0_g1~~TRINITY_DN6532_c0_g1_i3.p1  ORF type:complete len:375 (+),score=74.58 TRINITY_DN6532_c0_g1_i3:124-1248(+)
MSTQSPFSNLYRIQSSVIGHLQSLVVHWDVGPLLEESARKRLDAPLMLKEPYWKDVAEKYTTKELSQLIESLAKDRTELLRRLLEANGERKALADSNLALITRVQAAEELNTLKGEDADFAKFLPKLYAVNQECERKALERERKRREDVEERLRAKQAEARELSERLSMTEKKYIEARDRFKACLLNDGRPLPMVEEENEAGREREESLFSPGGTEGSPIGRPAPSRVTVLTSSDKDNDMALVVEEPARRTGLITNLNELSNVDSEEAEREQAQQSPKTVRMSTPPEIEPIVDAGKNHTPVKKGAVIKKEPKADTKVEVKGMKKSASVKGGITLSGSKKLQEKANEFADSKRQSMDMHSSQVIGITPKLSLIHI